MSADATDEPQPDALDDLITDSIDDADSEPVDDDDSPVVTDEFDAEPPSTAPGTSGSRLDYRPPADHLKSVLLKIPRRIRQVMRFSLRTLLVVATIVGLWLGYQVNRALWQKDAANAIEELGGWVYYDYQMPGGTYDPKAEPPVPRPLREWVDRNMVSNVVQVNLVYNDDQPQRIDNTQVTDEALAHLPNFRRLKVLLLHSTQATDEGMKYVGRLKGLERLYMWDARELGDYGVQQLARLHKLKYLHINGSRITDESLRVIGRLEQIEGLSLQGNRFTDRGLVHLKNLKRLESLWIGTGETQITDQGLRIIARLPALKELDIQGSPVTLDGLERLKAQKPRLKIHHAMQATPKRRAPPTGREPQLEFLARQHVRPENEATPLKGPYWLADGTLVQDQEKLAPLRRLVGWDTTGAARGTRFLFLFVSHGSPGASLGELEFLQTNGEPISKLVNHVPPRETRAGSANEPGWSLYVLTLPPEAKLPDTGMVQLRYSAGPWEDCGSVSGASKEFGSALAKGVVLLAAGQTADNRTFLSLEISPEERPRHEFDVQGEDNTGKPIAPSARLVFPGGFTALFDAPLSSLKQIHVRRRPKHQVTFSEVSLRPRR